MDKSKSRIALLLPLLASLSFAACGDSKKPLPPDGPGPLPEVSPSLPSENQASTDDPDATVGAPPIDTTPRLLIGGTATLNGMTRDGYVVYRGSDGLYAVAQAEGSEPTLILAQSATAVVRGRVVFVYTGIDYQTNLADLSVWTAASGTHEVGRVLFSEDFVAASEDGAYVAFVTSAPETTVDVTVATSDLAERAVVLPGVGRSSESTCRARFAFARDAFIAATCEAGSTAAALQRFTPSTSVAIEDAGWASETLATGIQSGNWSTDATGAKVFFVSAGSQGRVHEGGQERVVDQSVTWGAFVPDGSALLYTVSDQLRRTGLGAILPQPVVTTGYGQRTAFSPTMDHALYSSVVSYEGGERRNLFIAATGGLATTVDTLVDGPNGNVSRSAFTADGRFVLWLTDITTNGATLNVRAVTGGAVRTFPNVDSVLASKGSQIVFSSDRSDASVYPITTDLYRVDLGGDAAPPTRIGSSITDGRAFQITPDGNAVVYVMPNAGADAATREGVWTQGLP